MVTRLLGCALLAVVGALAQITVYSEFQRVDPFGNVVAADRAERSREVLSPQLVRNTWASVLAVIEVPEGRPYRLFLGQNPENAFKVDVYRVLYEKRGETWIPDALERLAVSDAGRVPDVTPQVPGQKVIALWLDIWVPKDAPVRRTRLEVQYSEGENWVIYPMELRIFPPVAPEPSGPLPALAPLEAKVSDSALAVLHGYVCGSAPALVTENPPSVRTMSRRNAQQDMAVASTMEAASGGKPALVAAMLAAAGLGKAEQFCAKPSPPPGQGAEWYLHVRDYLYKTAQSQGRHADLLKQLEGKPAR